MKRRSPPITKEIVLKIKSLLSTDSYNQHDIAAMLGINQGRISETKHGKYDFLLK